MVREEKPMRLINIEDVSLLKTVSCGGLSAKALWKRIKEQPTIDAVEVVRCGRCEWWRCNLHAKEYGVCKRASYDDFDVFMNSDDFCSYGKRREDGEE